MKTLKVGVKVMMKLNGYAVPRGTEGVLTGVSKRSQNGFNYLIKWDLAEHPHVNPFDKSKCTWADEVALEVL